MCRKTAKKHRKYRRRVRSAVSNSPIADLQDPSAFSAGD
jgi:hypothetical protein